VLYMFCAQALTLQYVLLEHVMQTPPPTSLYPSAQTQSPMLLAPGLDVMLTGHELAIPVTHHIPGLQSWHGAP